MGWWDRRIENFNQTTRNPPGWVRVIWPPLFIWMAIELGLRRGWIVGTVALVFYGAMGIGLALWPRPISAWSQRNPGLDGLFLGPFVFLAVAYWSEFPLWSAGVGGLIGLAVGYVLGRRRGRRMKAGIRDDLG